MRIGGGFNWSSWDSTQLGGHDVTGLQSGRGDTVWVGLDSWRSAGELNRNYPYFSRRGIVRQTNSGPTAYRGGVLPSDTILALAAHPQGGVWFATDSAFYRFTPPSNVLHIKPLPQYAPGSAKVTVNVLMADTVTGGFYAGTNNGVYHYYADSLRHLSYPSVSLKSCI
jgi:hypothetical protein